MGIRSRLGAISYSHTSGTNPRDTLTLPSRQPPQAPKVAIITLPANQLYGCFTGQGASPDQPPARTTADLPGRGKQAPTSRPRQYCLPVKPGLRFARGRTRPPLRSGFFFPMTTSLFSWQCPDVPVDEFQRLTRRARSLKQITDDQATTRYIPSSIR